MRLIDADEAKKLERMLTLKPSEKALFRLMLDRMPTYEPPNPPLTLDELRQVDREPLWLRYLADGYGEWVLFEQVALEGICDFAVIGGTRQYDGKYGKDWLAYRRKLEDSR